MTIESPLDPEIFSVSTSLELDNEAIKRSLKFEQRRWRTHGQYPYRGDSESKQHDMSFSPKGCLPKGVVRGCIGCSDCQKVSARWDPKGACSCIVEETPVFHPHEEEFKDTFKYIDSIRRQVEPYGLCRIIPPPSWQSPCFLEEDNIWQNYKFPTKIQRVNELGNHCFSERTSGVHDTRAKRRKLDYEFGDGCAANFISDEFREEESSQSAFGPQFTLIAFKRHADYFKQQYFSRDEDLSNPNTSPVENLKKCEPSEVNIEGEYWRIIEKPTAEIDVLSATDLDQKVFGDGFSVSSNRKQETDFAENHTSGWNLSNISRLPDSLLSLDTLDSSSHFAHRLHVGMCFSSLPWNVEQHCLYQLYYLHPGAPRIWYGIPASDSSKFEAVQKKQFPNLQKEHLEMRHSMVRQLSPATLKSEDVHVYRCIQRPGEFVLFLPGAYNSGFDCGFNFSASAVFAPFDWLLHGLTFVELYREQRRKILISFDRMLLRAANEVVKAQWECLFRVSSKTLKILTWKKASGKNGILASVLRMRIRSEARCRKYLSLASQSRKMDMSFYNDNEKRECNTCYYHLYLSAVNCPCSPNKFSCLKHAKNLCSCPWIERIFLFRFTMSELEILSEAVEGKVTAIGRWVKKNLGQALYKDNKPSKPETEPTKDPCLSIIEDSRVPSEEDKGCALVADRETSNGSSEVNTSSSSSSEMDIEAYIEALSRGKLSETKKSEAEVDNIPRGGSVFEKGNTCQIGNVICLSDDDDD